MGITKLIQTVQKNPLFRFISSVRMAVPLMLILAGVVAAGTLYEARYNGQVASLYVYRTWWFQGLMGLLWLNIFAATLSRVPFKRHHTGFVITHIGLLTLLAGAQMTATYGIDGQLRVEEGRRESRVSLSELAIKVGMENSEPMYSYRFKRSLNPESRDELGFEDFRSQTGLIVERYLPFVERIGNPGGQAPADGGGTPGSVGFNLTSNFFNVNESLDVQSKPEMQMGPARIRVVMDSAGAKPASGAKSGGAKQLKKSREIPMHDQALAKAGSPHGGGPGGDLVVKDSSGKTLATSTVEKALKKPIEVAGARISVSRLYQQGMVSGGKLVEGGQPGANPAAELMIAKGGKSLREVAFAKFPQFSINKEGTFGLHVEYHPGAAAAAEPISESAAESVSESESGSESEPAQGQSQAAAGDRSGNVIEFHLLGPDSDKLRVELYKNNEQVLTKVAGAGEQIQTPWMGMKITVSSIGKRAPASQQQQQAGADDVRPVELVPKMPLPPAAIFVRPAGGSDTDGAWIVEGEGRTFRGPNHSFDVYFGPDTIELPFTVGLQQFRKMDYPGTDMAMSFESTIQLDRVPGSIDIKMNEPLHHEGYVLYQSSYELGQAGRPNSSIFSVNRDPGRWVKYIGAIILILGIAVFTIMRTRWYARNFTPGAA
jgi:hypothetical protein